MTCSSLPRPASIFFLPFPGFLRGSKGEPSRFCWLRMFLRLMVRTRLLTLFSSRRRNCGVRLSNASCSRTPSWPRTSRSKVLRAMGGHLTLLRDPEVKRDE
ncbi:hypothetical protein D3C85_1580480 [compost metagenome]